MRRHELDPLSLLAGLFFTLVGLGFVLAHTTDVNVNAKVVVPVALIAAGLVGLVSTFASSRSRPTDAISAEGEADSPSRTEPPHDDYR